MKTTTTKYAIYGTCARGYFGPSKFFLETAETTTTHETVSDALLVIRGGGDGGESLYGPLEIHRVIIETETTPGSETRRVLGEIEAAREGESVKYALTNAYAKLYATTGARCVGDMTRDLGDAALFTRDYDAISLVTYGRAELGTVAVVRVAVSVTPETTRETRRVEVLA